MAARLPPRCTRQDIFWGEIAPCEHFVQMYANDEEFLDALESFVVAGFDSGDAVVAIATGSHREGLERRLAARGRNVALDRTSGRYLAYDAEETLGQFMVEGWPDEQRFIAAISAILVQAQRRSARVRAFGEMVALLWARGQSGATVRLEHLWNQMMREGSFSLFCAYPKAGFTQDSLKSLKEICAAHSSLIEG